MSDEPKENDKPKPSDGAEKPAKKAEAAAPPPPELGVCGKLLEGAGLKPVALPADAAGTETVQVDGGQLKQACERLRDDAQFDLLLSVSGVDNKTTLTAVYHLYSTKTKAKLVVKANGDKLPSVVSVWPGADWHEREAYDLFGIQFDGHPNLKRILMPDDWVGHPLRKDYTVDDPRLVWNER
ncbi:MAG: NADH-quinone oxidoreductase subunit C [Cyanobacteria bacterium HKST-UBA04]|nr:NADH-quinone oxidoreductase subunit C [Cyanobacteria bacterium HKST-UBA04]MCA9841676.1 NADH-quinone oxidoreductase subunit C [Cyanobacteria bacterium HKST-UBA03]